MNQRSPVRSCCRALAVLAAVFLPTSLRAVDPEQGTWENYYESTHVLRRIFYDQKYAPLRSFEELATVPPQEVIVFFLGSVRGIDRLPGGLVRFVENGGAVLIATSKAVPPKDQVQIGVLTGVEVTGQSIVFPSNDPIELKQRCYESKIHCPILVEWRTDLPPESPFYRLFHDPERGLDARLSVYANNPTRLNFLPRGRRLSTPLAALPAECIDEFTNETVPSGPCVQVGGVRDQGRYLMLANDRLFLNRMMLPTDTGNVEFAQNCLSILEERANGTRKKLLFVEYGTVNGEFNVPLRALELPDNFAELVAGGLLEFGKRLPAIQENLAHAEDRDALHRSLWRFLSSRGIAGRDVLRWLFVLTGGCLFLYGCYRVIGPGRYRVDPASPALRSVVAAQLPKGPLFERRRQEMLANNNLWEAARHRAQVVLKEAGLSEMPLDGREPRVEVLGPWWQRWQTRRRARRLWRLAFDPTPQVVPKSAWKLVNRELDDLRAALSSGEVRFV